MNWFGAPCAADQPHTPLLSSARLLVEPIKNFRLPQLYLSNLPYGTVLVQVKIRWFIIYSLPFRVLLFFLSFFFFFLFLLSFFLSSLPLPALLV